MGESAWGDESADGASGSGAPVRPDRSQRTRIVAAGAITKRPENRTYHFENKFSAGHAVTASAARCDAPSMAVSGRRLSSERWLKRTAQLRPSWRRTKRVAVPGRLPVCQ